VNRSFDHPGTPLRDKSKQNVRFVEEPNVGEGIKVYKDKES
jgi:hypothetical protein